MPLDSFDREQIWSNIRESKSTTIIGIVVIVATALCVTGVVKLYLSPETAEAWCAAFAMLSGGTNIASRGFRTPPR